MTRAKSLDANAQLLGSSPPTHHSPLMSRRNGSRGKEVSDIHICVLCLRAIMNNSVSVNIQSLLYSDCYDTMYSVYKALYCIG